MERRETAAMLKVLLTANLAGAPKGETVQQLRDLVTAYQFAWGDLPREAVQGAVARHVRAGKFFPAPSEVRSLVVDEALGVGSAEVAWDEVRAQIAAVGSYGRPEWSSAVLADTVRTLGWEHLCRCDEGDLGTLRAHFHRTFAAYRERFIRSDDVRPALEEAAQHRKGIGQRAAASGEQAAGRLLSAGPPASRDPGWEAAYRATGEETPSTRRARERWERARESRRAPAPPPEGFTVLEGGAPGVLGHLPAWRALPEERRAELLDAAGYGGGGADVAPPPEDPTPTEPGSVGSGGEGDDGGAP